MAWLETDWSKELEQVNESMGKLMDEKVEPMIDRALDRGVQEMSLALDKAAFEVKDAVAQLSYELTLQRQQAAKDARQLIHYAALVAVVVFVGCMVIFQVVTRL